MKSTAYKLFLSVFITFVQVIASSLTGRAGGESLYAQDAFYIYRNDGDFNGFFFDEVKRMGYSKFDLDSVEHDVYVVQEVETADSLYRIPLAAIDSIGFQQPEIKLNPNLKFIGKCGLLPYLEGGSNSSVVFYDVPMNLMPKEGDILVGLPTDKHSENVNYVDGSFSCIVERIVTDRWDNKRICCYGHAVESFSDVFEQYITIEDLEYDEQGNMVRRRVAGMPKDTGDKDIISLKGTIQREWNPDENSSISLSADVGVTFRVRLAYDIGLSGLFIKLTRDLLIDVEPALAMSISRSFNVSLGNSIAGFGIPLRIWFPTECPIFELEPYPDWFVRGEGKVEAKLNFPKSHIGFGEDIIFDTKRLFPIDYDLHWVPEKNTNDNNVIDIGSTNVKLSGYVQTGLKFHVSIGTANWFKRLFHCDLGVDIYAGPKIGGEMEFSTDWVNNEGFSLYNQLKKTNLNVSWLSVDINAGTTASVLWKTPMEKTFFQTTFPFFCDTMRFIPRIEPKGIEVTDNSATFTLKTHPDKQIGNVSMDFLLKGNNIERNIGHWSYSHTDDDYTNSISFTDSGLKSGGYSIVRSLTCAGYGPFEIVDFSVRVPNTMQLSTNKLVFDGYDPSGKITRSVSFKTNCPRNLIRIIGGRYRSQLKTIDESAGLYEVQFTIGNNHDIFSNEIKDSVSIQLDNGTGNKDTYYIECIQKAADLNRLNIEVSIGGSFNGGGNGGVRLSYVCNDATIKPIGDNSQLEFSHSCQDTKEVSGFTYYEEDNMSFIITKEIDEQGYGYFTITEGTCRQFIKKYSSTYEEESNTEYSFCPISGSATFSGRYTTQGGKLNSAIRTFKSRHSGWLDEFGEYHEEWSP